MLMSPSYEGISKFSLFVKVTYLGKIAQKIRSRKKILAKSSARASAYSLARVSLFWASGSVSEGVSEKRNSFSGRGARERANRIREAEDRASGAGE